jgi:hypothetical protein
MRDTLDILLLYLLPPYLTNSPYLSQALLSPSPQTFCAILPAAVVLATILAKVLTACTDGIRDPFATLSAPLELLSQLEAPRGAP